jgi:DNA-binding transcriptional ArsR family regulator
MPKNSNLNKGARIYVESALSTASHPLRRKILKHLKKDSQSTIDLEAKTSEDRYNLYHHLGVLEKSGLIRIDKKRSEGKLKYYEMNYVDNPTMAVFSYEKDELVEKSKLFKSLHHILEQLEDYTLPESSKINKIEIFFSYD